MIAPASRASTTTCRAASTLRRTSSLSVAPAPLAISTTSSIRSEPPNPTDADAITSRVLHRTRSVACAIRFRASSVTTVMLRRGADPRIPEELFTARLLLRRWRSSDLDALAEIFARREVWEFPFGRGLTREETEYRLNRYLEAWEHDGFGKYAVEIRGTGSLIGYVGLELVTWFHEIEGEVEIGWRVDPGYWGDGYATEASLASLQVGFDHVGRLDERIGVRAVSETVEPRFDKVLEVRVVEREGFEELIRSRTAVADDPCSARGSSTRTRAR